MKIRLANQNDAQVLIQLIAKFRQTLTELRGKTIEINLQLAKEEFDEYRMKEYPIYVAEADAGKLAGYLVCRVDGGVVWAESLYVEPAYRRKRVGSLLYAEAEALAESFGSDTLYNWVDPNNTKIIHFLQKRGYNVLNLIELRRPRSEEKLPQKIRVGENQFDHF